MSDGWIYVTGKKSFKNQKRNANLRKHRKNPNFNLKLGPSEADETVISKNFEKITKQIYHVYNNERQFLVKLLKDLKQTVNSEKVCIYALGCGTIENQSMVLSKSCIYQLGVCIIIIKVLNVKSAHVYDPVMTKNDHEVWKRLIRQEYEFEELLNLTSSECICTKHGCAEYSKRPVHTILWMPHCEKFLYKAVLKGILRKQSPLAVSKTTSKLTADPSASEFTASKDDFYVASPVLEPDPVAETQDKAESELASSISSQTEEDSSDLAGDSNLFDSSHFTIENTTLVGNNISEYVSDEFLFLSPFNLNEKPLLPFNTHPQSFNDTFITTFKSSI